MSETECLSAVNKKKTFAEKNIILIAFKYKDIHFSTRTIHCSISKIKLKGFFKNSSKDERKSIFDSYWDIENKI